MNRFHAIRLLPVLSLFVLLGLTQSFAFAQDNTITYQGQLQNNGQPFEGTANLEFRLFDAFEDGNQLGLGQTFVNHPVDGGLFQVELTFTATTFAAGERFLEVWVNGAPLTPRQAVSAAPLALHALNVPDSESPFSFDPVSGDVIHASVNQAIRFEPRSGSEPPNLDSPSVTIGHPANSATAAGSAVLGGGAEVAPNIASGEHSVVAGGINNHADGYRSFIGGGSSNQAPTILGVVGGGAENTASGNSSVVAGGFRNAAAHFMATVSGGADNCAGGRYSWAGGRNAIVRPGSGSGGLAGILGSCASAPVSGTADGDNGTFIWSDDQPLVDPFVSSGPRQFLVRAAGGALFTGSSDVNSPAGNRLRVNGTLRVDTLGSAGATALCHNANNQLASCSSSARYKRDIENLGSSVDLVAALRPVRYRWIDGGQADIGFVAEEVAELMPELITRNEAGEIEGVRYDRLSAVLVAAMQEQRTESERSRSELAARNAALEARLAALEEMLLVGRDPAGAGQN
ncbi:tail fiber domain-containing protein [Wenzhouxiangella sediminis]|uniref:Peptidase S74 domain-containing protein n=1 Tax=Wenzhouxiangella sediminis TaxID=1792836 RepID=A0A3E1KDF8_9GAMM|nr:tail fiber domain-containing protein [Wenzhouxiangella sediminis]RFF33038.1 hypothetical protein DZC52_00305 [Wenzhouxiangella sediminis]